MGHAAMMMGSQGSLSATPTFEAVPYAQAPTQNVECAHPLPWHHLLAASALGSLIGGVGVMLLERQFGRR